MLEYILKVLEYVGAFFIILGMILNGTGRAFDPKFKIKALIICNVGCLLTGIMLVIVAIYGTALVQLFVILANANGIKTSLKKIKHPEQN